ncbi:KCNH6, partial [Symbiodinium microadriaticum]
MDRRDTPLAVEDVVLALRGASMVSQDYASEDSYEDDRASTRTKSSRCSIAACIMYPDNNVRRIWTALVVFLLGYIGTVFLYRLIFIRFYAAASEEVQETDFWIAFDGMVDVMFIVDLWIQFLFTYTNERGKEVASPRKIACRYLTGWFWVNMISCIPEDAASAVYAFFVGEESIEANNSQKTVRLMRMQRMTKIVRMLRLAKLTQLTERLNLDTYIQRYKVVAVLNTLFGLIWVVHVMACGWYLCATLHEDVLETWLARRLVGINEEMLLQGDPFDQWAHAMYFIFSVFTTVGFGDISAFTTSEIMYVTLTMMVGAVVHSIIIGQVINEVTSDSTVNTFLKNKLKLAKEFAVHAQLDSSGSKALSFWLEQNIRDLMGQQYKMDEMLQLIANDMPLHLMKDLHSRLFNGQLTRSRFLRVPFVSSMPPRLPMLLSLALVSKQYEGNQLLFQAGDAACHLYLVLSGTFAFVARPERQSKSPRANDMWPYQLFSHASYFGNYELHTGTKQFRRSTARCETPQGGQVLRLQKDHYQRLCGDFPQFAAAWKYEANRRESHRCWLHANHTRMLTYRLLAVRRIQKLCRFYLRKADKTNKDEAMKTDSSGLLVPGRNSLRSSCSSTAISEGMGSVSMCSVLHENSDSSAGRKPLLPPSTHLLNAGPEDEDARQRRLIADVAMLRSEVEMQGETLTALRREMARLPFLVAAALK